MSKFNPIIVVAALLLICLLVAILVTAMFQPPDRPPPVSWRGKLQVLRRYGVPGTLILLTYWKKTWDTLLHGTVPMPQRWTVKTERHEDGLPDD